MRVAGVTYTLSAVCVGTIDWNDDVHADPPTWRQLELDEERPWQSAWRLRERIGAILEWADVRIVAIEHPSHSSIEQLVHLARLQGAIMAGLPLTIHRSGSTTEIDEARWRTQLCGGATAGGDLVLRTLLARDIDLQTAPQLAWDAVAIALVTRDENKHDMQVADRRARMGATP